MAQVVPGHIKDPSNSVRCKVRRSAPEREDLKSHWKSEKRAALQAVLLLDSQMVVGGG